MSLQERFTNWQQIVYNLATYLHNMAFLRLPDHGIVVIERKKFERISQ